MGIYWIGTRNYDIKSNNIFNGSITMYGEDHDLHFSLCNAETFLSFDDFIKIKTQVIIENDNEARFMFADERKAYQFGKDIFERSIYLNPLYLLNSMNDKIFVRNLFSDYVKTPPSILINPEYCTNYDFICNIFSGKYSSFVLQEAQGAGGLHNYFLSETHTPVIAQETLYLLVTPYFDNNITVNVHIVVSESTYKILPPSVQITLDRFKYSGSDFIAFSKLSDSIKNNIFKVASQIAQKVITLGAKGIFGIDFIILNSDIFFMECNYRYQGSTFILNKGLLKLGYPSIFEIRRKAFNNTLDDITNDIYFENIPFSSFRCTKWNENIELPAPIEVLMGDIHNPYLSNGYIKYYIFDKSIVQYVVH